MPTTNYFNPNCKNVTHNIVISIFPVYIVVACLNILFAKKLIYIQTNKSKIMIYKYYKVKSAGLFDTPRGIEIIKAFGEIYKEHDVTVIGTWYNVDDTSDTYYMTGFKNDQHYSDFVEKMKSHQGYQELSKEMGADRLAIEGVTLKQFID